MLYENVKSFAQDLPDYMETATKYFRAVAKWVSRNRLDIAIGSTAAVLVFAFILTLSHKIPPELMDKELNAHVWFEADLIRVYDSMIDRKADNHRTNVHPLQAILTFTPVMIFRLLGAPERLAVILFGAVIAGLWAGLMFSIFRGIGLARLDSLVFTSLGAVSGASLFWFTVPEAHGIGSISVIAVFAMLTIAQSHKIPLIFQSIVSAMSLSITSTNWMAGLLAAFSTNPYRRAVQITLGALLIVTIVFGLQKMAFYRAQFFVPALEVESQFLLHNFAGSPIDRLRSFFLYSMMVPPIPFLENPAFPEWTRLSIQLTKLSSFAPLLMPALILWVVLLGVGLHAGLNAKNMRTFVSIVCMFLVFQIALNLVYGDETFIYALNFFPILLLVASFGAFSKWRPYVLAAATILTIAAGYNNISEFLTVTDQLRALADKVVSANL